MAIIQKTLEVSYLIQIEVDDNSEMLKDPFLLSDFITDLALKEFQNPPITKNDVKITHYSYHSMQDHSEE